MSEVPDWNRVLKEGREYYEDLGYGVVYQVYEYRIEFKAYESVYVTGDEWLFPDKNKWNSHTPNIEDARVFLDGHVKWDGCSNWDFCTDKVMIHFCGREGLKMFGDFLNRLYDLAAKHVPAWSE